MNLLRRVRPSAEIESPALPTGWYTVLLAQELPPNAVLPLRYFERDLVAFRGEDGVARVLDARCPHLGAHLGHGGKVSGNNVRCPFHGWCFDSEGACVEVPYSSRIPPQASIGSWHTRELNGVIMVWFDDAGAPPRWEPPALDEASSPLWLPEKRCTFTIRTTVQEIAENGVDKAHLTHLHGIAEVPSMHAETEHHVLRVRSQIRYPLHLGGAEGNLLTTNWGLGIGAARFSGLIDTFLLVMSTPIERNLTFVRILPYLRQLGDADMQAAVGRIFVGELETQFQSDIPIWENKVTLRRPMLAEGDGPIGLFRRWTRQFYSAAVEDQDCAAG